MAQLAMISNKKLKPIILSRDKVKDENRVLAGGSLLWIGRECRPDLGASCAVSMSWSKEGPTVRNIKFI